MFDRLMPFGALSQGPKDAREVLGRLKLSGSTDCDELHALAEDIARHGRKLAHAGKWLMIYSILLALGLIWSVLGIVVIWFPLGTLILSIVFLVGARNRLALVREGFTQYCAGRQINCRWPS